MTEFARSYPFTAPPETVASEVDLLTRPEAALILRDLVERVTAYESNNPDLSGQTPSEDDYATVALDIFDREGAKIGRTTGAGRMLYRQKDSQTFLAYFGETITLVDGNIIRAGGLVDDGRLTAGEWASFPAAVVEGPLRGAIGYRTFRPLTGQEHRSYESAIVVYKVGA